jgi:HEAT repeat protein
VRRKSKQSEDTAEDVAYLSGLLKNATGMKALWAVGGLANMVGQEADQALGEALGDRRALVRQAAAAAIARRGTAHSDLNRRAQDMNAADLAESGLWSVAKDLAIARFAEAIASGDAASVSYVELLGAIHDDRAVAPLVSALRHDSRAAIREVAAEALGVYGHPEAISALIGALDDNNRTVRKKARGALIAVGKPATEALIAGAEESPSPRIRNAAKRILGEIAS